MMLSSVTLPEVVEKYPRAQNRLPQYRLRNSGNSIWIRRQERPLIRCMTSDSESFGGIDKNMWT